MQRIKEFKQDMITEEERLNPDFTAKWANVFLLAFLAISLAGGVLADDSRLNHYGGTGPDVLCIYPVDGQYSFLQRILFYLLLLFGVLARRRKWLVVGALTTAMSYSGAAAIHAMFLVASIREYVDLNIYAIYSITSTGVILSVLLLIWSTTLGTAGRRLRYIVLLWFTLVMVGSFFTIAEMYGREVHSRSPACVDPETIDTSSASLLPSETKDCSYVCHHQDGRLFHTEDQIMAWPNRISPTSDITGIYMPTAMSYLLAFIIIGLVNRNRLNRPQREQHHNSPVLTTDINPRPRRNLTVRERIDEWWKSRSNSVFPLRSYNFPTKYRFPKFWQCYEYIACFLLFAAVGANGIMNEVRMHDFPMNEEPREVGQWAPWVAVGLVILAQMINKYAKLRWEGRSTGDEESGFNLIRQNLEASMTRRGWIAPRQLIPDDVDELSMTRAETWNSKRRYSL